jgi:hypothetical protein
MRIITTTLINLGVLLYVGWIISLLNTTSCYIINGALDLRNEH